MAISNWQVWFYDPGPSNELQGGIYTVDSQLRASMQRLTTVEVRRVTLPQLILFAEKLEDFRDDRIILISHVDVLSVAELDGLTAVTLALRELADSQGHAGAPVHFSFINRDPTSSFSGPLYANDADASLLERIRRFERSFDRVVCVGPRMYSHLTSQWPSWGNGKLLELGGGMLGRPELIVDDQPILRPTPKRSNVRVLFGSPTSPTNMSQRGLDIFARAAGLVQAQFVDRHVDVTFVVSGIEPDVDATQSTGAATGSDHRQELVDIVEHALVEFAKEVFDGNTEFEVRPQEDRSVWLQQELDRADILVLPSRDEPFGLVAAEALSKGKPVIVSQNSGFGETLLDFAAESFLPIEQYVCPLTPQALARAIVAVIEDGRSRRLFRQIAHGIYPRLSWGNAVHQLLNCMELPDGYYRPHVELTEAAAARIRASIPGTHLEMAAVLPINAHETLDRVRFNVPIVGGGTIKSFETNKGRSVTLETTGSLLFVRKTSGVHYHSEDGASITDTKRHWQYVNDALKKIHTTEPTDIYPTLYESDADDQLTMEYYAGGSLDQVNSLSEAERLTEQALTKLVWAAQTIESPKAGPSVWEFCTEEFHIRRTRLQASLGELSAEDVRALSLPHGLLQACEEFINARISDYDHPTPIAIHGDLMLNNVVFAADALRNTRIAFIDTRARWDIDGSPRWDLAMDLASLLIYTGTIQPVLVQEFAFGTSSPLHGKASTLVGLLERAVEKSPYGRLDPAWRARVEVSCAVRLLGSISAQLGGARSRRIERARRMADLAWEFVGSRRPIDWMGTG